MKTFPRRDGLSRAVGTKPRVTVEVNRSRWQAGDVYLLCTDGVTNELTASQITALMRWKQHDARGLTDEIVTRAKEMGGRDNITCVAVRIPKDRTAPFAVWSPELVEAAA